MDAAVTLAAGLVGGTAGALLGMALLVRSLGRARKAADQRLDRIEHMLTAPDQAWYWTPEWQAGEAEADADLKAARSVRFGSAEEMDAYLASIPLPDAEPAGSGQQAR